MVEILTITTATAHTFTGAAGGNNFKFFVKHALSDDTYYMDIDVSQSGNFVPLTRSVKLTCGIDLFIPWKRWGLGTLFVVPIDPDYYTSLPKADTITTKFKLVWEHE